MVAQLPCNSVEQSMRLAEFILANIEPILADWEAFARSLLPGTNMTVVALRDDAVDPSRPRARHANRKASSSGGEVPVRRCVPGARLVAELDNASDFAMAWRRGAAFSHITEFVLTTAPCASACWRLCQRVAHRT